MEALLSYVAPLVETYSSLSLHLDRWLQDRRIRQRPRTEQPHVRVLPIEGPARPLSCARKHPPYQPLPAHLAPSLWKAVDTI